MSTNLLKHRHMNQNRLKTVLVTMMLFPIYFIVSAQYEDTQIIKDSVDYKDNVDYSDIIPGRLFNNNLIDNTGSVATISGKTLSNVKIPNLYNSLSGKLAGLFIIQGKGEPGNDNPIWLIRGGGSYGSGLYNACKLYVDGFEVTSNYLKYLNNLEIERISILKDAASLSTFGMQGANGVIWIETARGTIGEPSFNLEVSTGIQQAINLYKPLDSYNFANLYNQAISNDKGTWEPYYSENELENYQNGISCNIDWYDEAMKKQGNYTNLDFVFHGGIEKAKYHVVLNYINQQGLFNVKNTDYTSNKQINLFNVRANFDLNFFDIFDAKVDWGTRLENVKGPNYDGIMNDLARYPSNIYPIYDELIGDDELNFSGTALYPNNPVGSLKGLGWKSSTSKVMQGNFQLKERLDFITQGLSLQQSFSFLSWTNSIYSKTRNYARYYLGLPTTTDQTTSIVANKYLPWGMIQWIQGKASLAYDKDWNDQKIKSFLDFHISDYKGEGLLKHKIHNMNLSGKVNYMYHNRYIGEFGFSYYGSDAYAPGNRWGFYPSLSAAWILSNEDFLKGAEYIDFLKVRSSVGLSGDINTYIESEGRYLYQEYLNWGTAFYTGLSAPFTQHGSLKPFYIGNKNVFAEKSTKYNIGLDLNLLKKLSLTADLFLDKRSDILTKTNSHMDYYGDYNFFDNIGKMTQKGFEIGMGYVDHINKLHYSLQGMFFYATSIIDFMDEIAPAHPYNAYTGRPYGTLIGHKADGFYQIEDFDGNGNLKKNLPIPLFGKVQPGDIRYVDIDQNGYIDQTDVTKIGNPSYSNLGYSLTAQADYKGFDLNIFFTGATGGSVNLLDYRNQFVAFVDNANVYDNALGAWAYFPDQGIDTRKTATYPRLTTKSNENNYRKSSFWIRNNNYFRLKNIEVGYDFSKVISLKGISSLRLFLNAHNPYTYSKLLKDYNMDPESGYGYPALRTYNFGVNIKF